jgi:hypothetical protein
LSVACAGHRGYIAPSALRAYEVLVPGRDTLSDALARALSEARLRVRRAVRGGSRATAVLVHQVFREPGAGGRGYLHGRLYDTRTSVIVAAATLSLDSVGVARRERAEALVRALRVPADTTVIP